MHPLETIMSKILENGEGASLEAFGDAKVLLAAAAELGKSLIMPEFLSLALTSLADADRFSRNDLEEFACRCVEIASDDFVIVQVVDILDAADPLPPELSRRTFERFIGLAFDQNALATSRSAALDGALRAAMMDRLRQLRLLASLLGVKSTDAPQFLARAAKIIGVAYTHWKEDELLDRLRELSDVSEAGPDARFELGMATLLRAIEAVDCRAAETEFEATRFWLKKSLELRPHCPTADVYLLCTESILSFFKCEEPSSLANVATALAQLAFQIQAWHSSESDPPWLGARHAEAACWNLLAITVSKLVKSLQEASWWEPAVVIEQQLLSAYVASRSILRRTRSGGVEAVLRPRIEESLFREAGQAYSLRSWLARNAQHEWANEARQLSDRLSEIVRDKRQFRSDTGSDSAVELLDQATIPQAAKTLAKQAVSDGSVPKK